MTTVHTLTLLATVLCAAQTEDVLRIAGDKTAFLPSPWARSVVECPGQWRGFWYYSSTAELAEMKKAGANFVAYSPLWLPVQRREPPHRLDHLAPETIAGATELRQKFIAPHPFVAVGLSVSGTGHIGLALLRDSKLLAAARLAITHSQRRYFLNLPAPQPAGAYTWVARCFGGQVSVWVRPAEACTTARLFSNHRPWPQVVADTWLKTPGGQVIGLLRDIGVPSPIPLGSGYLLDLSRTGMWGNLGLGTQNNAFFTWFPTWFWERYPDAFMVDSRGQKVFARGAKFTAGWPVLDHPAIISVASRQARAFAAFAKQSRRIVYWVLGGESLYPTYVDRRHLTDYSPPAMAHWRAWCRRHYGREYPAPRQWRQDASTLRFIRFREQALAEVFQYHALAVRSADTTRPALVPVHGDIYGGQARRNMGMNPALWAAMGDGFETGQILYGSDRWKLNLRYFQTLGSFGLPIAAARLLQVRRDPTARGGQRGFSPDGLRRAVYEALGMGAWHIGLVQWAGESWDGEWAIRGTPAEAEARRVFSDLKRMAPELSSCYPPRPSLAMYLSDTTWLLDGWQGAWTDLHLAFVRWHIPVCYLGDDQLCAGDLSYYRCLLTMDNARVPVRVAHAIEAFVRRGGCVIVAGRFAETDELLQPLRPFPAGRVWSRHWHITERDEEREVWRLGRGKVVRIVHPDYRRLPAILRRTLAELYVRPPVAVTGPGADRVEAMVLTDALNPVAVLLNTSAQPAAVAVRFERALLPAKEYAWADLRSGQTSPWRPAFQLTLPPHDVAVLQARAAIKDPRVIQRILRTHLHSARQAAAGRDTPLSRSLRRRIMWHLRENRLHKALACAAQLACQMPMSAHAKVHGQVIEIAAQVSVPPDVAPDQLELRVRFSPTRWKWWTMSRMASGLFLLRISRADLPRRYDASAKRYCLWWGPLRAHVQARAGLYEAEHVLDISLPR